MTVRIAREPHAATHRLSNQPSSQLSGSQPGSQASQPVTGRRRRRACGVPGTAGTMQSLQDKASEWSGVAAADAFAIDEVNVFEALGGTPQPFVDLSTNFYTRVYEDEEEWFREIFSGSKKEDAIQNQYEFLVQRMGGPPLFSQRRGHPALIGRHRPFPVTHRAAERWLHHMQQALETTESINPDTKTKMMNFFRHTAYFLVAGNELTRQTQSVPPCKHATSKPVE